MKKEALINVPKFNMGDVVVFKNKKQKSKTITYITDMELTNDVWSYKIDDGTLVDEPHLKLVSGSIIFSFFGLGDSVRKKAIYHKSVKTMMEQICSFVNKEYKITQLVMPGANIEWEVKIDFRNDEVNPITFSTNSIILIYNMVEQAVLFSNNNKPQSKHYTHITITEKEY